MNRVRDHLRRVIFGLENANNMMYGHAGILRDYCGTKLPVSVPGLMQHGWSYGPGIPLRDPEHGWIDRDERLFTWNPRNAADCRSLGYHNVRVIGAPLLYLPPTPPPLATNPRSLLLFPAHSCEWEPFFDDVGSLYRRYFEELRPVLESFSSTTVCLYWREFDDTDLRNTVADHGFEVTSVGHRDHTPDFVSRLRNLILRHEYVSSNSFSTALFYSLYLEKKVFVCGQTFLNRLLPGKTDSQTQHDAMSNRYPQLDWDRFADQSHQEIGADEIGAAHQLDPKALRAEMGWSVTALMRSAGLRATRAIGRRLSLSQR